MDKLAEEIVDLLDGFNVGDYPYVEKFLMDRGFKYEPLFQEWVEGSAPIEDDIDNVFTYWEKRRREVLNLQGGPRMKLDGKRRSKIEARLKEGYTVDDLKQAIDGMLSREHNVEGGYTDIELCLRDQAKVEMFRQHAQNSRKDKNTLYKEYEV